jgi:alanine dehydrogenase
MRRADLLIGAVPMRGATAPKLVDIAIDQGGCSETSHPSGACS